MSGGEALNCVKAALEVFNYEGLETSRSSISDRELGQRLERSGRVDAHLWDGYLDVYVSVYAGDAGYFVSGEVENGEVLEDFTLLNPEAGEVEERLNSYLEEHG